MKPVIPFLFHLFTSFRPEQALAHQRSANGREKTLSIFYFFSQTDNLQFYVFYLRGFTIRTHGNTRRTCVTDHHSSIIAKVDWWTFNIVTLLGTPDMVVADLRILCYNWDGKKNNQIRDVLCGVLNAAYIISYWAAYANSVDLSTPVSSTLSTCRHVHFITIRQDGPRETTRRQYKQEGKGKLHHGTTKPVEKKINKATFKVNSPADGYADSVKGSNHEKKKTKQQKRRRRSLKKECPCVKWSGTRFKWIVFRFVFVGCCCWLKG